MKATLLLLFVWLPMVRAEDVVLGDTKAQQQNERFVWSLSPERIAKLTLWKKEKAPPISPQKAEAIAYAWSRRQSLRGFIPERPYVISLIQFPAPFDDRYFYKVHFATSGADSFWTVHIL